MCVRYGCDVGLDNPNSILTSSSRDGGNQYDNQFVPSSVSEVIYCNISVYDVGLSRPNKFQTEFLEPLSGSEYRQCVGSSLRYFMSRRRAANCATVLCCVPQLVVQWSLTWSLVRVGS